MDIEFAVLKDEIVDCLKQNKIWVLATSASERVSARSISIISKDLDVYFQTNKEYLKYQKIIENERVALCWSNVQIEGVAKVKGNSYEKGNEEFVRLYQQEHRGSFESYTRLDGQVIIEVNPKIISVWRYIDSKPYIDFLDVVAKKATRIPQKHMTKDQD